MELKFYELLPNILVFSALRNFLIRHSVWSLHCFSRHRMSICLLNVSFLSIVISNSITPSPT